MIRIYFAHSKLDYGSRRETNALLFLHQLWGKKFKQNQSLPGVSVNRALLDGFDILCPNHHIGECSRGMGAYLRIVDWCDRVAVLEHNHTVGRGVLEEVIRALERGKPVEAIRQRKLVRVSGWKNLNPDNWKDGFAELITV